MALGTDVSLNLQSLFLCVDVAQHITEYLDYKDQLSMARVCKQFEDVIINFVWKSKYKHVEMFIKDDVRAISNYTMDDFDELLNSVYQLNENRMMFDQNEIVEFLNLNAFNIENFYIVGSNFYLSSGYFAFQFPNVKTLLYFGIILSEKVLQIVAKNCPKLEKLILNSCVNAAKENLILGDDIRLATIESMTQLKSLTIIEHRTFDETRLFRYENIREILSRLKLQQLRIDESLWPSSRTSKAVQTKKKANYKQKIPNLYEELEIGKFQNTDDFVSFYTSFLGKYANLSKLSIIAYREHYMPKAEHCIPKQFFRIINKSCKQLTSLTIKESKISNFIIIPTLTELELFECKGLSWINLTQILSEMKLISFKTERTFYSGTATFFEVATTLRSLEIDLPERYFTEVLPEQFKHITYLKWHSSGGHIMQNISSNFPNLESLILHLISDADKILQLTRLNSIMVLIHLNFSDVLLILQHSTLREFTFGNLKRKSEDTLEAKEAVTTNLRFVRMLQNSFSDNIDFWLDMLSLNPNLSLVINISAKACIENEVFQNLANNSKMPQRLKSVKLCGFHIDLADLKNNFDVTMKKVESIDDVMSRCPHTQCLVI